VSSEAAVVVVVVVVVVVAAVVVVVVVVVATDRCRLRQGVAPIQASSPTATAISSPSGHVTATRDTDDNKTRLQRVSSSLSSSSSSLLLLPSPKRR